LHSATWTLFISRNKGVASPIPGISSGMKTITINTWRKLNLKRENA
jgi:hypothetical protein